MENVSIEWFAEDRRDQEKEDPAFYTWGSHTVLCIVHHNNRSVEVACDGEMRVHKDGEIARYTDALEAMGIICDKDVYQAEDNGYEWTMNTWFDLYDANEPYDGHLDCVCYSLTEAIEQAVVLCAEGIPQEDDVLV